MKKFIALIFLTVYASSSFACSTFLLSKNGQLVFGRNYDWVTGNGMVMINAAGQKKTSSPTWDGKSISWTSDCGSITFNQFGKDFPNGGMNEKGLVVELMWLSETKYPEGDSRPSLDVLQWIQYQLDNCATVDEVLATDKVIRISSQGFAPLHYLVADARGQAATIEFLDGKMVVHKGKDLSFPVLTNTVYGQALQETQPGLKEGASYTNYSNNSVDRFATACRMVQQFQQVKQPPVDYAFTILKKVAQGDFTKWSIVYDITARQIHFITNTNKQRKTLSLSDFNFDCKGAALAFNMNGAASGKISNRFTTLDFDRNKNLLQTSVRESGSNLQIPDLAVTAAAEYYRNATCAD